MSAKGQSYQSLLAEPRNSRWSLLPWTGLVSLLLSCGCGVAALVIGLVSNGMTVDSWNISNHAVQPSVLLSVLATMANALLRIAFTDGVAIAWWFQSSRGVSLGKLRALYEHGHSIQSLLTVPSLSRVSWAACAMLLTLADGPLFQRAFTTTQSSHSYVSNTTVGVSASPLMIGATGVITGHDMHVPSSYTLEFAQMMKQYNSRSRISIPGLQYSGTIAMELVAPGWDVKCTSGTSPYRLISNDELESEESTNQSSNYPPRSQTMFEIDVDYLTQSDDDVPGYRMQFSTSYKSTPGGNGTKIWRKCTLTEAVIRYPLSIVDGSVFQNVSLASNMTEYLVTREYEESSLGIYPSSLGGFSIALEHAFATTASLNTILAYPPVIEVEEDATANQYLDPSVTPQQMGTYDIFWTDPTDAFLATAHELALRAAITLTDQSSKIFGSIQDVDCYQPTCAQPYISSPDLTRVNRTVSQIVQATMTPSVLVYHTAIGWLVAGFATIVLACALVAPLFWGWWALERTYTLNPLDTAKAFDAPLLGDADPSVPPTEWAKPLLGRRVRYGKGLALERLVEEVHHRGEEVDEGEHRASNIDEKSASLRVPKFWKLD